ncbi:chitobiosyldiphosphodolichol beta-mannosyltransferase-like isoform 2-T2 [Cochliomyia hominivorax]
MNSLKRNACIIVLGDIGRSPRMQYHANPPGIPTLFVCYLYCVLTRTRFIIDWHNYTYTILGLGMKNGEKNKICRIAKWIEKWFGKKADANFCVTKAMKEDLNNNWDIRNVTVLYDRPPSQFQPFDITKKHELFMKLSKDYPQFLPKCYDDLKEFGVMESTALTQKQINGTVFYKQQRMGILVSSTSWTPDEDFSILLNALEVYEKEALNQPDKFPFLLCIITGKGPQKKEYQRIIDKLNYNKIGIITPWLDIEDYPVVLAAADLGVCLHWSSSGLDLPMKVVDMFGCGLPVCAYNFKCLNELVKPGQNGFIFKNHQELAQQLVFWFESFPNNPSLLETKEIFRKNLEAFQCLRWHKNWRTNALPIIDSII